MLFFELNSFLVAKMVFQIFSRKKGEKNKKFTLCAHRKTTKKGRFKKNGPNMPVCPYKHRKRKNNLWRMLLQQKCCSSCFYTSLFFAKVFSQHERHCCKGKVNFIARFPWTFTVCLSSSCMGWITYRHKREVEYLTCVQQTDIATPVFATKPKELWLTRCSLEQIIYFLKGL